MTLFKKRKPMTIAEFWSFGHEDLEVTYEARFPHQFTDYQQHAIDHLDKWNIFFWGRRAGKDAIAFYLMVKKALAIKGCYYYIFPDIALGKTLITGHGEELAGRAAEYIPEEAIKSVNRSIGVVITLYNGSTIIIRGIGSSQHDRALRGSDIQMIILSEYAYYPRPEELFNAIMPALARSKGQLIIASTPKPNSHLVTLYETMQKESGWYISKVTQRDNKYLTDEEFSHVSLPKNVIELEFNCDYTVPDTHAVFYDQLKDKYVLPGQYIYHRTPVFVAMDLGITDSDTVFWWCTECDGNWVFFDYFEAAGQPFSFYVHELERRKLDLKYAKIFVPHDIVQPEFAALDTRLAYLQRSELPLFKLPRTKVMDSIDRTRLFLEKKNVYFTGSCDRGLMHLKNYSYRDACNTIPDSKSRHSHATDAFRYVIDGLKSLELI